MTLEPPVFIVGAPRSGTTLLASMLAGHSRVACGPETQFFNKLSEGRLAQALSDPRWPARAVKLITSLTLAEQPVHSLFGHTVSELEAFLAAREPSVGAMLESLTELYAGKRGKPRWAEKTPNHILHLNTLRQSYPQAPIVRIVRDPRDCALSMRKLPWASPSVIANGYLWASWFAASQAFFEADPRTLTVRYEDLVDRPLATLTTICTFIGEAFEPAMLESHKHGRLVASPNETWKASNTERLNSLRMGLWRRDLDTQTLHALTYICQEGIRTFGYPEPRQPERTLQGFPITLTNASLYETAVLRAAHHGTQIAPTREPHRAPDLLLLPALAGPRLRQLNMAAQLGAVLLSRRLRGLRTHYLPLERTGTTWAQLLLLRFTQGLATPYSSPRPATGRPARAPAQRPARSVRSRPAVRARLREPSSPAQRQNPRAQK